MFTATISLHDLLVPDLDKVSQLVRSSKIPYPHDCKENYWRVVQRLQCAM